MLRRHAAVTTLRFIPRLLAVAAFVALPLASASAALILNIDLTTQKFDWVDGSFITHIPDTTDDNRFGSIVNIDALISSPLPDYIGVGTHYAVAFDFNAGGTALDGIAFYTTSPPGNVASFSGTPALPSVATFTLGNFSNFANIALGSFDFAPIRQNWNDVVTVNITASSSSVPEPTSLLLLGTGLGVIGLAAWRRRK